MLNSVLKTINENRNLFIPLSILVLLIGLYTIYWNYSASRITQSFDDWIQRQNESGKEVSYSGKKMGGYPYRYSLRISEFSYSDPAHANRWAWKADNLRLAMYVYNTSRILADLSGRNEFAFDEELTVEARAPMRIIYENNIERAHAALIQKNGQIKQLSIEMDNLRSQRTDELAPLTEFSAEHLEIHSRKTPPAEDNTQNEDIDLYSLGQNIVIPTGDELTPSSETLKDFKADLQLLDFETVLRSNRTWQEWADDGGAIKLLEIIIQSDDYDLLADGVLKVDDQRRLQGNILTRVGKHNQLVDHLVSQNIIRQEHARTAKTVLQALAFTNGDQDGRIKAPLTFQGGKVKIGPAEIASLRPLY